jgi:signal transduction histidine kinase
MWRREGMSRSRFKNLRSLRYKLLILTILLSLLPLAGISGFSFYIGSRLLKERIRLSVEKMAQDTADKMDLVLREKKSVVQLMATTFPLIYPSLHGAQKEGIARLMNNYCFQEDFFDVLLIVDREGRVVGLNTANRYSENFPQANVDQILKSSIFDYPEEAEIFKSCLGGGRSQKEFYHSRLVEVLYAGKSGRPDSRQLTKPLYDYDHDDISYQYNVGFSEPIRNPYTSEITGSLISIMNWFYFQWILDSVEKDLFNLDLKTGYAFMFARDANTIIGHRIRANRSFEGFSPAPAQYQNLYNSRLIQDLGLRNLHDAIVAGQNSLAYEFPKGNSKISGLARIDDRSFGWIIGVGIDSADIFRPVRALSGWLLVTTLCLALLVVIFTYTVATGITVPLKNLISTAQTIARGQFSERVQIRTSDEVGVLGATFNEMARALAAREEQLQELNKNLENMVRQRTQELENSHEALKKAYLDLQSTQEQLVQSEKMASLGQLVAGIAHEIKNPLNFIYGNTGFLADYTKRLQSILEEIESLTSISEEDRARIETLKKRNNYAFIKEDLQTLIDNFTEGARRINNIVSDLRTFSRLDADAISEIDLHASLEMSLNLLRNQYKNRITIHREFGEIPKIQGYAGKLSQVFMNLLSNAFHAVPDKGDVWIRTRCSNSTIEVQIEDNGVGIPKEHLSRVFEPFFTTKPVGQGTGLGLSISYGIIEQHHGKIHVASTPQKGSIFTVRLPVFQEKSAE